MNASVSIRGAERATVGSLVHLLPFLAEIAKSTAAPVDLSAAVDLSADNVVAFPTPAPVIAEPAVEPEPMPEPAKAAGPDFAAAGLAEGGKLIEHEDGRFRAERTGDLPVDSGWHHSQRDAWQSFCRKAGITFEPTTVRFAATVDCAAFAAAMIKVCRVVEKHNTIPILDCVLLRYHPAGIELRGTDMDAWVSVIVPGNVDRHFRAVVNAHLIKNLLRKSPDGQLEFLVAESSDKVGKVESNFRIKHSCGLDSTIPGRDPEDFPLEVIGEGAFGFTFTIPAERLHAAFGEVEYAISTEESRYYLNGVYLHTVRGVLTLVATDGHRLSKHEIPEITGLDMMPGVIIPSRTVDIVGFNIPAAPKRKRKASAETEPAMVTVEVGEKAIRFSSGSVVMTSKLIDGSFPDYVRVIPDKNDKALRVNSAALADAIYRLAAVSVRGRAVKLDIGADKLVLSMSHPETGTVRDSIPCEFDGGPFEIGFNSDYLRATLARVPGAAIFKLADPGSPTVIEGGASLHVLMPMRV